MSKLLHSVPKLTGTNYHDWKFAIQMVLRRAGIWDITSGTKPKPTTGGEDWEKKADEALTYIGLTIDTSQYSYIRDATNGVEAWEALRSTYEKDSRAMRISLKRQFYNYQHDESLPIREYITGITTLAARLKAIKIALTDVDITDVLIFNLHESWGNIAASLTAATGELKLNDVTGALIDEEGRQGGPMEFDDLDQPTVAMYGSARDSRNRSERRICFRCHRPGHIQDNCHAKRDVDGKEIVNFSYSVNEDLLDAAY